MAYQKNIIKKLIQISLIASSAVVASFLIAPSATVAATLACGSTITTSATLDSDISCPGTAIIIGADNIVLDCAGHTITYQASFEESVGYGINIVGFSGITIKNCNIVQGNPSISGTGAHAAIFLSSSNYSNITNNTITTNGSENNAHGVHLYLSSNNTITDNVISTGGYNSYGAYLYDSSNNNLTSNTITTSGHFGDGAYLYDSSNNNLTSNTITTSGYTSKGATFYQSSNNTITDNVITTTSSGIDLLGSESNYNTVTSNTITTNGRWGRGISASSNYNTLTNNTITTSGDDAHGVSLWSNSNNNITGNNITTNGIWSYGVYLYSSSNNSLFNNFINAAFPVYVDLSPNSWNTTKTSGTNIVGGPYLGGNFWANPSGTGFSETCIDADNDLICDSAYILASGNVDYLPLALAAVVLDTDSDGIADEKDNCPLTYNPEQADFDSDGLGDVCDPDDDNDGVLDVNDLCQFEDARGFDANSDGCIDTTVGLQTIIETLNDEVLSNETKISLVSKVDNALKSLDKKKDNAAISMLNAFINEVNAQRGKKISGETAGMLVAYANNVIISIKDK